MKTPDEKFDEEVQKALALKRHESPPPRFFSSFSDAVHEKINDPDPPENLTWYQRLGFGQDWKPSVVGGLALAVLVVSVGLVIAFNVKATPEALPGNTNDPSHTIYQPAKTPGAGETLPPGFQRAPAGTNGVNTPVMTPTRL